MMTATQPTVFDLLVQQIIEAEDKISNFTPSDMVSEVPSFDGGTFEPFYVSQTQNTFTGFCQPKKFKVVGINGNKAVFEGERHPDRCGISLMLQLPENDRYINEIKVLKELQGRMNNEIERLVDVASHNINQVYLRDLIKKYNSI